MTELEQILQSTLRMQRELFREELTSITKAYEKNLQVIRNNSSKVITDQQIIIEKQNETLQSYAEASKSIEFKLEDRSLQTLKNQVKELEEQVLSLKTVLEKENQGYRDLEEAFRELQSGLGILEEKL